MATQTLNTEAAHTQAATTDEHGHHGGPKIYAAVLFALLILTAITVAASYFQFGSGMANVIIAMLIASMKASLVALFFMHLRWDKPISAITFCAALFFLGLFLMGCYTDHVARPPSEPGNLKTAIPPGGQTLPPGGQIGPHENQVAPVPNAGHATGVGTSGEGGPAVPGASPEGNSGGPAAGKEHPSPQVPTHQ